MAPSLTDYISQLQLVNKRYKNRRYVKAFSLTPASVFNESFFFPVQSTWWCPLSQALCSFRLFSLISRTVDDFSFARVPWFCAGFAVKARSCVRCDLYPISLPIDCLCWERRQGSAGCTLLRIELKVHVIGSELFALLRNEIITSKYFWCFYLNDIRVSWFSCYAFSFRCQISTDSTSII